MEYIQNTWKLWGIILIPFLLLTGCEDVIDLDSQAGPSQLVVDGWINNTKGPQSIRLTWSAPYFSNAPAKPVVNATVVVEDNLGTKFEFMDPDGDGRYVWGNDTTVLGTVGRTYTLTVRAESETYQAVSELRRVPAVDSIVYQKETLPVKPEKGPKEGYVAQFYARDFPGEGDTYWIKPLLNGQPRVDNPRNISIAYDAAFNAGAPSDGLIFILPLRQSITVDSLYSAGNMVGVELHSIPQETFEFLKQVREQAANGGLFATPIANVVSNITNTNSKGPKALGFFTASAVSKLSTVIDPEKARPEE